MFGRWLFVRLTAAEKALRQGRIDDAFAMVCQADLAQDPRGQRLRDELVRPLLARARLHRQAGRLRDAMADLDRVAALDRAGPDILTLRQEIEQELRDRAGELAGQVEAVDRAADLLQAGRLETGRVQLGRIDDSRRRAELGQELGCRVRRASEMLEQAEEALGRDDVLAAVRIWREAGQRHGRTRESDALALRLAEAARLAVERWLREGRIDRLLATRESLGVLMPFEPSLSECEKAVGLCASATAQFAANDYPALRRTLLRLQAVAGNAGWITSALDALGRIAEAHEDLLASPIGLAASGPGAVAGRPTPSPGLEVMRPPEPADVGVATLDRPLLLLVDGGGSSLLLRQDMVRIGHGGASGKVELALPAEVQSHHADVLRQGEDYLLTAHGPVQVNGRPVRRALLRDGDRIELSGRAKLTFHRPSVKSMTAVLRLSHRCRLPQDVGTVILFCDTCLVGPGPTCHVQTQEACQPVILFDRGGVLHAGQSGPPGAVRGQAVRCGQTLEYCGLRLTVKAVEAGGPSG